MKKPPLYSLIYITTKNEIEAVTLARLLIESRLAACANIVESIRSLYCWKGKFHDEREALLILKTKTSLVAKLITHAKKNHSYECPCIVSFPIEKGSAGFLKWIGEQVSC